MTHTLTLTNVISISKNKARSRNNGYDAIRRRALDRLYERKAVVDGLIDSLEDYQRCRETDGLGDLQRGAWMLQSCPELVAGRSERKSSGGMKSA